MYSIEIISSSVRIGRRSHRVALYLQQYLKLHKLSEAGIIDLKEYNFPLFEERLKFHPAPTKEMLELSSRVESADGLIIVTPEYNGGYPASLKNVIDLLYDEWHHKPVAISTVSEGAFGGTQVITSLQFSLWKMHALTVPSMLPFPKVQDTLDEEGKPLKEDSLNKRTENFIGDLIWLIKANKNHD